MATTKPSDTEIIFGIIAQEVGVTRDELEGETEFADLGVDNLLAKSILAQILDETKVRLPATTFDDHPTASSLHSYLQESVKHSTADTPKKIASTGSPASANPLSIILQGKPLSSNKKIFLLPDGSGSGMAYLRLPIIDPSVCLIGMNSPFVQSSGGESFTVEGIAEGWVKEIRLRQPEGPYILGGWSAGGYYAFEVAKILVRAGQKVEKLILIDSPCRLVFEELPMEVVHYLSTNNLMGNWGSKKPPSWLVEHFEMSIRAISEYTPTPMDPEGLPEVFIIWAEDGVLKNVDPISTGLDFNVKVTRFLIQERDGVKPHGWERLFPGAKLSIATMPGNHFTIVYPPEGYVATERTTDQ
ncbi:hypothetical protein G7Y89_g5308 [Cudoniella acicularis]|uniref:Carrier domain-containing protein n=1 Tax=Cudoniella acicularis TaxID=354080 RepID=A0A8H4RPW9_9HELO|nr:hypothetical protein G7Y89_g5308 [Cudoniella acicularis]